MNTLSHTPELQIDEAAARPASASVLRQDRLLRSMVLMVGVATVPLALPLFRAEWQAFYGHHLVTPPFLAVLMVAIRYRLRDAATPVARLFWCLIAFSFAWWMVASLTAAFSGHLFVPSTLRTVAMNGPFLMFYGLLIVAIELYPHAGRTTANRLRTLDRIGSSVLLLGLLLYFIVVPEFAGNRVDGSWASSLALFLTLDAYIILRLCSLVSSTAGSAWRAIYGWLLTGAVIWTSGDTLWALMYAEMIPDPGYGTGLDMIWPLSFTAVVAASRCPAPAAPSTEESPWRSSPALGLLVASALLPLALHVSLYRSGLADPVARAPRELLALGITSLLAAMALAYHRLLRSENQRLIEEEAITREELTRLAFHDELTGLPNRNLFRDRLQQAVADSQRYGHKCAVMFCDLDRFKVINDSLGHEAGDRVLVIAGERLGTTVREVDTVARLGGDEFAVIVPRLQQAHDAVDLAERLLATVSEPVLIGQKRHVLTTSIGIAIYPDDGRREETLLKHADTAMYQAKLHGRNTFRLFTQAMHEAAEERLTIEQGLRTGLIEDEFAIRYQAIVDLATGEPRAYEALLRWNHPDRGYISPVSFIDVAEQTGLIVPIGRWILETACAWVSGLAPTDGPPPAIAVNMSPRQLKDPGFVDHVCQVLEKTGIEPSRLHLEMTESLALAIDAAAGPLDRLRALGVRIAIDDFGTGYSALSLLRDLPVDIVKIDRSFVQGIETDSVNEAIVFAIVNMARALDLLVIAEGVETESELTVVRNARCDAVQGYYFSRPVTATAVEEARSRGVIRLDDDQT